MYVILKKSDIFANEVLWDEDSFQRFIISPEGVGLNDAQL